jgi:hypothetical protein
MNGHFLIHAEHVQKVTIVQLRRPPRLVQQGDTSAFSGEWVMA